MPVDDLFLASTFSPRRVRAYATQVEVLGTAPEHVRTLALIDNELVFGLIGTDTDLAGCSRYPQQVQDRRR